MSIRAMSGFIQGAGYNTPKNGETSKVLLKELMYIVKDCQTRYGGKTELATEQDQRILKLCTCWEYSLSHGLKTNASVLKNVTDIMSGGSIDPPSFWDFAHQHLTPHEKERFSTLRHVWSDRGKARALIRAAFNERSMERYILIWLNDVNLKNSYEYWALMRDNEATNLLPSIAAGLGSILFAITVDSPELNVSIREKENRSEPIIAVTAPKNTTHRKIPSAKQQIISFEGDEPSVSPATSLSGYVQKSLSIMCLKYPDQISGTATTCKNTLGVIKQNDITSDKGYQTLNDFYREPESPSSIKIFEPTPTDNDLNSFLIEQCIATPPSDSGVADTFQSSTCSSSAPSKHSSMNSSITSIQSTTDITTLKARLHETLDRCSMLENRVAELSLENHRLKGLNNTSRHGFNYFSVSVPRVLLQRNRRKKYYAYEVHIIPTHGGDEWTILRRYNEFYKLHKKFQKDNVAVKTLDFPPKKNFGNMDAHFVEQRRQRLQVYLRHLLAILPDVAACTTRSQLEQVFPFFK